MHVAPQTQQPIAPASDFNWYKPGKSIAEFHRSKARTRALIGGRGCGKTTALGVEVLGHGWHNPGAKIYILRKTQESNDDTTLETFEYVFRQCGTGYQETEFSLFKKMEGGKYYRIPSLEAVRLFNTFMRSKPNKKTIQQWLDTVGTQYCSFIHFSGVPDATQRASRFRGYECSMLIFVEADQLQKEDLEMAMACLRWKNAFGQFIDDTCCILDTNPPGKKHWIALMEDSDKDNPDVKFWHIPTEENRHNLPPNYIEDLERMWRKNPAMFNRMLRGQYDDAFDGNPVLFAFTIQHAFEKLPWPRGAYLVRGWDFGTSNSIIYSAYWEHNGDEYWWDLHEYFATQSDVERQCRECWRITREVFPFYNDRNVCSGVLDACDPAGNARTDKGRSIDVLRTHQIFPKFQNKHRSLQLTLSAYNRLLERKDRNGQLVYRIDKEGCPMLYLASLGGYRYPTERETGYGSGEPGKGPDFGNFDHIADASRYAKINFWKLMRVEIENLKRPVGKLSAIRNPNPPKQWR